MKKILLFTLPFLMVISTFSQDKEKSLLLDGWSIFGQAHIVPYIDGRDFNNDTYAPAFTTMRTNFGVKKSIKSVDFIANLQDSRILGQTGLTNHTTNRIGLLEAYVKYNKILNSNFSLQVGAFQMDYGNGRVIGSSPWNFTQRSFDGGILSYKTDKMFFDVFVTNISTPQTDQKLSVTPADYPLTASEYEGYDMFGFWFTNSSFKNNNFSIFGMFEDNAKRLEVEDLGDTYTAHSLARFTVGGDYKGTFGDLAVIFDGAYQFGSVVNGTNNNDGFLHKKNIAAYIFGLKGEYKVSNMLFTLGTNWHSGTAFDETEKWNTFDNSLGRKHLFMGFMDYFIPIRSAYGGAGVNDFHAKIKMNSQNKKWNTELALHYFMANAETKSGETNYGQEIDWTTNYVFAKGVFVQYYAGVFLQGPYMKQFWNDRTNLGFVSYVRFMVTVN